MRAVLVSKKSGNTVHALLDEGRTYCGKHVDQLDVVAWLDIETLPPIEGCRSCLRIIENWPKTYSITEARHVLPPSSGVLRKRGPLSHGLRPRGGRKL